MSSDAELGWDGIDDARLGRLLREVGSAVEPSEVYLAARIRASVAMPQPRQAGWRGGSFAVAAAIVVIAGVLVTVIAPARSAVAGWLGLGATSVVRVDELPAAEPAASPTAAPVGQLLDPAAIRTAAAEQLQLTVRLPAPALVGGVEGWEIRETGDTAELVVAWDRFVFSARAPSPSTLVRKAIRAQDVVSTVELADDTAATWIEGFHVRTAGEIVESVGSTLLWEVSGVEYRVFGELGQAEALEIANSVR